LEYDEAIRWLRDYCTISGNQSRLAERMGISYAYLSLIMSRKRWCSDALIERIGGKVEKKYYMPRDIGIKLE
jgi:hypothetical protein